MIDFIKLWIFFFKIEATLLDVLGDYLKFSEMPSSNYSTYPQLNTFIWNAL